MTPNPTNIATAAAWLAAAAVGATIIWTGVIKAIAPHTFRRHLASLGWIPPKLLSGAVTAAATLEAIWGTALMINVSPGILLPASIVMLAALSTVSWWGVKSGRASDCGCYGGFIQPSIAQSIGLNALFSILLAYAWLVRRDIVAVSTFQIGLVIAVGLLVGSIAEWAQRYERKHGEPKFVASPLKVGAKWNHTWAHNLTRRHDGEFLVALLGPECPYCKQWVKIGNATIQSPTLPKVFGVVGVPAKQRDRFVQEHGIRFPVASISSSLMSRLTQAVPTTMMVDTGTIKHIWVGSMPPEFVQRFRRAFFPDELVEMVKEKIPESASTN